MIPARLIETKRDGGRLDGGELRRFLHSYLDGTIPDYQMSAFLMAVVFRGLEPGELEILVEAMLRSGATLDLAHLPGPKVDKHSTGGVGDKVSLVLAPLAAELGIYVPMMSGRGLGHTGGTLDKLEAIPGFRTSLTLEHFLRVLEAERFAMIGQTEEIAPLDRRLYALRSATGTVSSVPLIAASIMSKKLAEGLTGLVLDVKMGAGAFLPDPDRARELARTMVAIGSSRGVRTVARLTAMDRPLGRAVGNALEVEEAMECLRGGGPPDLREVTLALAADMLRVAGLEVDPELARRRAGEVLNGGAPMERFLRVAALQGGDARTLERPGGLPRAPRSAPVPARGAGWVQEVHPVPLGWGVVELGGGRVRVEDPAPDPRVGFVLAVAPGDRVEAGDPLGWVHASSDDGLAAGARILEGAVALAGEPPEPGLPLVGEEITSDPAG